MHTRKVLLMTLLLAFASPILPVTAQNTAVVEIEAAPPPQRDEAVPPPRPGYTWAPGHWSWDGSKHVWVAGNWVSQRDGFVWITDRWMQKGTRYVFTPGHWVLDEGKKLPRRVLEGRS